MTTRNRIFLLKLDIKRALTERKKDLIFVLLLILVSSLSFALGYITNRNAQHAPIVIKKCP